ncbi:hypothetical protein [Gordonia sp. NB41Y]|nr:hypothetical protein [Gordonia sp. NB41Y]EMP12136.1 hypothetical protein ISGA_4425 [Gordonia sp. NB41Y]WLP89063.1 hypothetical protein Q9K23_15790 [Gordonia sp. NB41Y]
MIDHSENALRAVIKSLRDVVAPAVDPGDPMAQEQLALSLGTLEFLHSRLDRSDARARFELRARLHLARGLHVVLPSGSVQMAEAMEQAEGLLGNVDAQVAELRAASARLGAVVAQVMASEVDAEVRTAMETAVLDGSEALVEFERSWYRPLGFDPHPESIRSLDDILGARG